MLYAHSIFWIVLAQRNWALRNGIYPWICSICGFSCTTKTIFPKSWLVNLRTQREACGLTKPNSPVCSISMKISSSSGRARVWTNYQYAYPAGKCSWLRSMWLLTGKPTAGDTCAWKSSKHNRSLCWWVWLYKPGISPGVIKAIDVADIVIRGKSIVKKGSHVLREQWQKQPHSKMIMRHLSGTWFICGQCLSFIACNQVLHMSSNHETKTLGSEILNLHVNMQMLLPKKN